MNYFDKQEERNINLLKEYNKQLQWFDGITANTRLSEIDVKATDKQQRLCHLELKERNLDIATAIKYGDILIETGKIAAFAKIMESGYTLNEIPLYINFLTDGIVIFNLNAISQMNYHPNHFQRNFGKGKSEYETRFGLKIQDAIIYKMVGEELVRIDVENLNIKNCS